MTRLGATFVKLGQVMSTRKDLCEPETVEELRVLQDRVPAFPMQDVRRLVSEELGGSIEAHFLDFDETPVAAASVSQVHRARRKDGREVAVKVLRPDVRENIERDAAILRVFARVVAWHPTARLSDPVGHLDELITGILEQTDLSREVTNYTRFRELFAGHEGVRFPEVHADLSARRVMTMEFLRGHKLDALPPGGDHRSIARRLRVIFMKMVFEDGFVHADLHPGNILVLDTGEIAIFDVGLVKHLAPDILVQCVDFTRCLVMGTAEDFVLHLKRFHKYRSNVDWADLEKNITSFLQRFRAQNVGQLEIGKLLDEILALGRRYHVRPVAEIALVMVALVTAEGIGKQLDPEANLFHDTAEFITPLLARHAA
jgi:ubiquinone biosynthesis protein